jgi:hypothetical protein
MKLSVRSYGYYMLCMFSSYLSADFSINSCDNTCESGSVAVPRACRPPVCCNTKCDILCSTGPYPCGTSVYIPRSQGDNTAREFAGWHPFIYKYNVDQNYTSVALITEFTKSRRPARIANSLFCSDCLTFSGSQFAGRVNGSEIIADNFGLSPFFQGSLKVNPKIENYILDFNLYFGLDEWLPGLFLRVNAPITHTKWNLGLDECSPCQTLLTSTNCELLLTGTSVLPCPAPACGNGGVVFPFSPSIIYPSLRVALSGDYLFGDMRTPWQFGRFSFCAQETTKLADLDLMLGLNLWDSPWYNFALYFKGVLPTGSRVLSRTVFEPIAGNGHHYEAGIGFEGHVNLLGDPCSTYQTLGIYAEGNITHLFTAHQIRSFDFLRNGLLSRYLLLKEFASDNITYTGNEINAINYNTRNALVSIKVKGDLTVKLAYRNDSWTIDLGYNIYGQSAEEVCIKTDCPCDLDRRRFGIKGTTGVCAREYTVVDGTLGGLVISLPLNATQSTATIFGPAPIDNPVLVPPTMPGDVVVSAFSPQGPGTPVSTIIPAIASMPPVLIHCRDLDPNSATQRSILTHKIFTHIGYIWFDTCWEPFVGVGGEFEFMGKKHNGLNQWGVWLKTGINF